MTVEAAMRELSEVIGRIGRFPLDAKLDKDRYRRASEAFSVLEDAIRAAVAEEREAFPSELRSRWEACGPWVPDDDLTEAGRADKSLFLELLSDPRLGRRANRVE